MKNIMTQDQIKKAMEAHQDAYFMLVDLKYGKCSEVAYNAHMSSLCAAHMSEDYEQDFGKPMPVTDQETQY